MPAKVFGIGFHKTGTTSLKHALTALGYNVTGPNGQHQSEFVDDLAAQTLPLAHQFDAFQDNPWPLVYERMDAEFPGSRFILTVREPSAWIASIVRHFGGQTTPMREHIYGVGCGDPLGYETRYVERMLAHNAAAKAYFANRPGDFLVLDIIGGDGWGPLCAFLDKPVPQRPFPFVNRAQQREARLAARPA